jgi:hypothetical protein
MFDKKNYFYILLGSQAITITFFSTALQKCSVL